MLIEGLKLMIMGMVTVMTFLSLMILLIQFVAYLSRESVQNELNEIQAREMAKKARFLQSQKMEEKIPVAVIAASIAAYEQENLNSISISP